MTRHSFWKYVWESTLGTTSGFSIFLFLSVLCVCVPLYIHVLESLTRHSVRMVRRGLLLPVLFFHLQAGSLCGLQHHMRQVCCPWVSMDSPVLVPFYINILGVCLDLCWYCICMLLHPDLLWFGGLQLKHSKYLTHRDSFLHHRLGNTFWWVEILVWDLI